LWGLDHNGKFLTVTKKSKYFSFPTGNRVDVQKMMLLFLQKIQESEEREIEYMKSKSNSVNQKQKRLLFLFQCDLLPGNSGRIFASKLNRDIAKAKFVSFKQKFIGCCIIFVIDISMLFYIFLFALKLSNSRQYALFYSFLFWLVIEIFLVGSAVVLILHFAIPILITKDVLKINAKLMKNEEDYAARLNLIYYGGNHNKLSIFNAADHLFVSTRVASQFKHLPIANAILQFNTPWPSQSFRHAAGASDALSKNVSESASSLAEYIFVVLNILINIPNNVQDTIIQFISTGIFDGFIVLCIQLYSISPLLLMIPIFVYVIISYLIYRTLMQISFMPPL
jgi:hypothetical protein